MSGFLFCPWHSQGHSSRKLQARQHAAGASSDASSFQASQIIISPLHPSAISCLMRLLFNQLPQLDCLRATEVRAGKRDWRKGHRHAATEVDKEDCHATDNSHDARDQLDEFTTTEEQKVVITKRPLCPILNLMERYALLHRATSAGKRCATDDWFHDLLFLSPGVRDVSLLPISFESWSLMLVQRLPTTFSSVVGSHCSSVLAPCGSYSKRPWRFESLLFRRISATSAAAFYGADL